MTVIVPKSDPVLPGHIFLTFEQAMKVHKEMVTMINSPLFRGVWVCLVLCTGSLPAQDLRFRRITSEMGLAQNSVDAILQDRQGFMWFGTWAGLSRFDGYHFENFAFDPDDRSSISDNWIFSLMQDSHGAIWIATREGLNRHDPTTERMTRFYHDAGNSASLVSSITTATIEDADGDIWIGTFNGLDWYRPAANGFLHFLIDPAHPANTERNQINTLLLDRSGVLWIGTPHGLWSIAIAALKHARTNDAVPFTRFRHTFEGSAIFNETGVTALCEGKDGSLWVGTSFGLLNINAQRTKSVAWRHDPLRSTSLSSDRIRAIHQDRSGTIWVGTWGGGLNRYQPGTDSFRAYRHRDSDPGSLSNDIVLSISEDAGGILWIGTRNGLNAVNRKMNAFDVYQHEPLSSSSLSSNDVWSVLEDRRGNIWAGTYWAGLNRIRRSDGTRTVYRRGAIGKCNVAADMVFAMHESSDGTIWFGAGSGLLRYNPSTDVLSSIPVVPGELVALCEDRDGSLWCGTHGLGLFKYVPRTGECRQYTARKDDSRSLADDRVLSLHLDDADRLWIGTANGLDLFNRASESFTHHKADQNSPTSLSHNAVLTIRSDRGGHIWVGTDGGGLNRLDPVSGRFEHYTHRNGLPSSSIACILVGKDGALWLSTTRGLCRCDPVRRTFENLDTRDGLSMTEFNRGAGCANQSGDLFFGGTRGIQVLRPSALLKNRYSPGVVLTALKIMNRDESVRSGSGFLTVPINLTRDLELPHDANTITLGFSAFDFLGSEKCTYRCKLEGFDRDWISLGNRNSVTYTNLDPGDYRFVVTAANSDGVQNTRATTLHLVIQPPFWKTRWAAAGYILLGLTGFVFIQRYTGQRKRMKEELVARQLEQEQQSALMEMKNKFFANISHEFRTPLTLILGPVEQLLDRVTDGEQADRLILVRRNATRLMHLINMILDLAKFEAREMKLRLERVELVALLRRITAMFKSLAESQELDLLLTADGEEFVHLCDRGMIEAAVSNLLSNACKYSHPGGRIDVVLNTVEHSSPLYAGWLCLKVSDTGNGIPEEHLAHIFERYYRAEHADHHDTLGTGIGLSLVKEIVELHDGVITVQSAVGMGTTFSIFLPPTTPDSGKQVTADTTTPEIASYAAESVRVQDLRSATDALVTAEVNSDRPLVLVIEDNIDLREFIRNILEPDYIMLEAENGQSGLEMAFAEVPDLVLSDVMMPGMDGYHLTMELKTHEMTSHIPVILLTAKASTEARIEGLEHGADDYLVKPFHEKELLVRIANLIENRRRLREKYAGDLTSRVHKPEPGMTAMDRAFLDRMVSIVEENMEDPDFDLQAFIARSGMSESQVRRKLRALTDQAPSIFIRSLRLKRAATYLLQGDGNVSEIAFRVGFNNLSYFSKTFQELYHVAPSEYRKV